MKIHNESNYFRGTYMYEYLVVFLASWISSSFTVRWEPSGNFVARWEPSGNFVAIWEPSGSEGSKVVKVVSDFLKKRMN